MKTIIVNYTKMEKFKIKGLQCEKPQVSHVAEIIKEECSIVCDGELVAVYKKADFETYELLKTCNSLLFTQYERTSGLINNTISINSTPRNELRGNYCRATRLRRTNPKKHDKVTDYARLIAKHYLQYFRKPYVNQVKRSYSGKLKVNDFYRIKGTPFTGGVINKNSSMNYHFDNANTKDGISCMIILRENIAGGELILPELNIGFACNDEFILLFDGQKYLHGVTNIISAGNGYRYTIVYYNNNGMHLCLPPDDEQKDYQNWLERKSKNYGL